ncbi:MAG TPA: precorrin-2 C(20)-methyltransferase [Dehalococcoidia bacterium]|nr:precorrin-2 C(20)-methyltransferase [Dehalococcoidia bacterium]
MSSRWGRFYGIGVGPGDPELLTLKAVRVLQRVPVVCYPQSTSGEGSMALAIAAGAVSLEGKELVPFPFSMSQPHTVDTWQAALARVLERLSQGQDCAFLTEGDPLLYSTFVYVYEHLRREHPQVPLEVVPGVSSLTAAAARAGVPLAAGRERIAVLPALYHPQAIGPALDASDSLVLLKVNRVLDVVRNELDARGLLDRAVLVRRATMPEEQVLHGAQAVDGSVRDYFSLLIVRR